MAGEEEFTEPRWQLVAALGAFIGVSVVLRIVEPQHESIGPTWLVPAL